MPALDDMTRLPSGKLVLDLVKCVLPCLGRAIHMVPFGIHVVHVELLSFPPRVGAVSLIRLLRTHGDFRLDGEH
jgi:hypothetical protein